MASIATESTVTWNLGATFVFTKFNYGATGDTIKVPRGALSAAVLVTSGTAPTAAVTQGSVSDGYDTVTLTGGDTGSGLICVTRHSGNPASQA